MSIETQRVHGLSVISSNSIASLFHISQACSANKNTRCSIVSSGRTQQKLNIYASIKLTDTSPLASRRLCITNSACGPTLRPWTYLLAQLQVTCCRSVRLVLIIVDSDNLKLAPRLGGGTHGAGRVAVHHHCFTFLVTETHVAFQAFLMLVLWRPVSFPWLALHSLLYGRHCLMIDLEGFLSWKDQQVCVYSRCLYNSLSIELMISA